MNLEEEFDKRVEKNFDIKKKRISILEWRKFSKE